MKYESGYLLLDAADQALLEIMMLQGAVNSCDANMFLSEMADCMDEATNYLKSKSEINDKSDRELLQKEMVSLYLEACETLTDRAKRAMSEAGIEVRMH